MEEDLLEIKKENAVLVRRVAIVRQLIFLLLYFVTYYFPEKVFGIKLNFSLDIFALVSSILIFLAIFDITVAYFRGYSNRKQHIEIIKTRIRSIDCSLQRGLRNECYNPAEVISEERRKKMYQEIINQLLGEEKM